jgi:hypothetical protein
LAPSAWPSLAAFSLRGAESGSLRCRQAVVQLNDTQGELWYVFPMRIPKEEAISRGLCTNCRARPHAPGRKLCEHCHLKLRESEKAKRERGLALGLCVRCGARPRAVGSMRCEQCLDAPRRRAKELYVERRLAGACSRCGAPSVPGKAQCERCLEQDRRSKAAKAARARKAGLCAHCGKVPPEPGHAWCKSCQEDAVRWAHARYQRYKEAGLCARCGQLPPMEGSAWCEHCWRKRQAWESSLTGEALIAFKESSKRWRQRHLELARQRNRERSAALRIATLEAYGGRCECCGESNPTFLTIDHVGGGGNKHRRMISRHGTAGNVFYVRLKKLGFPRVVDGFPLRILCWNCNMATAFLGTCPHQRDKTGPDIVVSSVEE